MIATWQLRLQFFHSVVYSVANSNVINFKLQKYDLFLLSGSLFPFNLTVTFQDLSFCCR